MTYASNVDIKVVARKNLEGEQSENTIGVLSASSSGNPVQSACVDWKNGGDMTKIDQIQLVPVSSSSTTQAVIYIKNISTVKKTDVKISKGDLECDNVSTDFSCSVEVDKQIDLSLFDSYTLEKGSGFIDLLVLSGSYKYIVYDKDKEQMKDLKACPDASKTFEECGAEASLESFTDLQNPTLTGIIGTGVYVQDNEVLVTFHPKSWYAATSPN